MKTTPKKSALADQIVVPMTTSVASSVTSTSAPSVGSVTTVVEAEDQQVYGSQPIYEMGSPHPVGFVTTGYQRGSRPAKHPLYDLYLFPYDDMMLYDHEPDLVAYCKMCRFSAPSQNPQVCKTCRACHDCGSFGL